MDTKAKFGAYEAQETTQGWVFQINGQNLCPPLKNPVLVTAVSLDENDKPVIWGVIDLGEREEVTKPDSPAKKAALKPLGDEASRKITFREYSPISHGIKTMLSMLVQEMAFFDGDEPSQIEESP